MTDNRPQQLEASPERTRALQLVDVLRSLPSRELQSVIKRLRIRVDEAKRIDVPSQVARALLMTSEIRDPRQLPGPTRELLYRVAEAKGVLFVEELPSAVEPLIARGLVFARAHDDGVELVLPIAFMLQMRPWEGEDPRGVRALLYQANHDVAASIASHYLGRSATPPLALSLECAWETLNDPQELARQISELAPLERKLLRSVEEVGGEVDTEELLDLEREPMRLRGASGATPSRRGVGFALERRGFLIPVHPNRHVVPAEVAAVVGAERRAEREEQRQEIRSFVLEEDHAPRRARFADDPVPLVLAMALVVRDPNVEIRPGLGTPRSLISKFGSRFGRDQEQVSLLASLSRAVGLWEDSVVSVASPPGSLPVGDLGRLMFDTWRRGGAWDEARSDGEMLRLPSESREASPVGVLREVVLEALHELAEGRWVPWEAVAAYVRADSRCPGIARLLERWAQRAGVDVPTPAEIARRIALGSLHVLGVVDLGDPDADGSDSMGPTLRITPRGRAYLSGTTPSRSDERSRFLDNQALRLGPEARIGNVMSIAPFIEIGRVAGHLDVCITQQTLSLALSAGFESEVIQDRLESIASLPDPIARLLKQASAVLGRAEYIEVHGFLWVEDPEVRQMLQTRRQTADLFVDPSPPSGLLIQPGVEFERIVQRCRGLGVEVVVDGRVYRTRSTAPPSRASGARRMDAGAKKSSSSGERKHSGTRRARRSSTQTPAVKRGAGSR